MDSDKKSKQRKSNGGKKKEKKKDDQQLVPTDCGQQSSSVQQSQAPQQGPKGRRKKQPGEQQQLQAPQQGPQGRGQQPGEQQQLQAPQQSPQGRGQQPGEQQQLQAPQQGPRGGDQSPGEQQQLQAPQQGPKRKKKKQPGEQQQLQAPQQGPKGRGQQPGEQQQLWAPQQGPKGRGQQPGEQQQLWAPQQGPQGRGQQPGEQQQLQAPQQGPQGRGQQPGEQQQLQAPQQSPQGRGQQPGEQQQLQAPQQGPRGGDQSPGEQQQLQAPQQGPRGGDQSPGEQQQLQAPQQGPQGRGQQPGEQQQLWAPQQGPKGRGQQPGEQQQLWVPQQGPQGRGQQPGEKQQLWAPQQGPKGRGQQPGEQQRLQAPQQGPQGRGQQPGEQQQLQAPQQGPQGRGQQPGEQQQLWAPQQGPRGGDQSPGEQQQLQAPQQGPKRKRKKQPGEQQQLQAPQQGPKGRGQQPGEQQQLWVPQQGLQGRGQQPGEQQQLWAPQQGPQGRGQQPGEQQQLWAPQQGPKGRGQRPGEQQQLQAPQQSPQGRGQQPGEQQQLQAPQQGPQGRGQQPGKQQQLWVPQQGSKGRGQQRGEQQQLQAPQQGPRGGGQSPGQQQQSQAPQQGPQGTGQQPQRDNKGVKSVSSFQFAPRIFAEKKSGKQIVVATNFFRLFICNPNIEVFHYDVVIEPEKPKYLIRSVWNKYVSLVFPGRLVAFDGKNAYSKGPLTNGQTTVTTVAVRNEENGKDKTFSVSIKEVRKINFSCFKDYRTRMLADSSLKILPEAEISVLDIIMRNFACDNFVRSNRTFFPVSATSPKSRDLSNKLSLRYGYFQSAFLGYIPYLNFDISHKAFYKDRPVLDILDCFRRRQRKDVDVDEMNLFIRNVKVAYQLPNDPSSYRIFRVNKLVEDANTQKFTKEDGRTLTVAQYFSAEKKCNLRFPDLPLLWVGPYQKSIYLPMEFCKILPDQVYKGFVDPYETREMVRNATSNARERRQDVCNVFKQVNINSHPLLKEFELKVSEEMEKVPARILDAPGLKTSRNVRVKDGVWRIQDFLEPVVLKKWCILILDRTVSKQNVMNLQNLLKDKGNSFNMKIAEATRNPIEGEPTMMGLKKVFPQLKDMEMVFVIISEAKGLYGRVKAICETQEGILTQCIKSRTVSQDPRKLSTTVDNILLKVNAKLGGKNHSLDEKFVLPCLKGYVMVVGADVTHPSPGMNIPSVAAVTVSYDPDTFQYSTTTRVQPKGEMIKDMEEIMSIHVKKFYELRKKYPEKIIIFRDGVSEGEMEKVLKEELTAIKRACNPYCQPKITFVIVQKRHHTRLYPTNPGDEQGKNFNVPVGTCVDSDIVHPRELEFYLVSHASILGTARPTRYRSLHDDNHLTDQELENLSFYLCHLFARCNRSVSYPSPTYNAHLAAARVRAYLEGLNLTGGDINDIIKKIQDRISHISPMFFV